MSNPTRLQSGDGIPITQTSKALDVNIKSGAIPAGTALMGKVGIDQVTANANEVVVKSITAGETHTGQVGGHVSIVTGTLTRPNDTPGAYSAKDEINTSTTSPTYITFTNVARINAGTGTIAMVHKKVNNAAATAQLRLHLYNAAPTPANDHAAFTQMWADRAKYIGYVDFGSPVVEGTGSDMAMVQVAAVNMPFVCAAASRNLFGRVEVIVAGAAPAASQVWDFVLRCLVD
jgi:hypothetical protein